MPARVFSISPRLTEAVDQRHWRPPWRGHARWPSPIPLVEPVTTADLERSIIKASLSLFNLFDLKRSSWEEISPRSSTHGVWHLVRAGARPLLVCIRSACLAGPDDGTRHFIFGNVPSAFQAIVSGRTTPTQPMRAGQQPPGQKTLRCLSTPCLPESIGHLCEASPRCNLGLGPALGDAVLGRPACLGRVRCESRRLRGHKGLTNGVEYRNRGRLLQDKIAA